MDIIFFSYVTVRLIGIIIGLFLFYIAFQRYMDSGVHLLIIIIFFGIGYSILNLNLLLPIFFGKDILSIVAVIHTLIFGIAIALMIIFFNLFKSELSPIRFGIALSLFVTIIFLVLTAIIYDFSILGEVYTSNNMISFVWSPISSIPISSGMLITGIFGYKDLNLSKQYALNHLEVTKINKMQLGTLSTFVLSLLFAIPGFYVASLGLIELSIWLAMIIAWIPGSIGLMLIGYSYAGSKQISFLQPQRVDVLLIVDQSGLPLFQYEFREDMMGTEAALISGAITAVCSLMKEAFNITSDIERIGFKNRYILVNIKKMISFILITTYPTKFLSDALEQFSTTFLKKFDSELDNFQGDISKFGDAEKLVTLSFGL